MDTSFSEHPNQMVEKKGKIQQFLRLNFIFKFIEHKTNARPSESSQAYCIGGIDHWLFFIFPVVDGHD
ncbi:hypothetical protein ADIS_4821 [Lunatimonas lonarensis]|uniref:Uncharacterized protein n=1 Tax=Lunatimonas lonarensis TaxID=1232681 RepID=R7ZKU1_9BACT|nr:hypothetical protein ADIS_4821 [Lunatimonas lonarensis]